MAYRKMQPGNDRKSTALHAVFTDFPALATETTGRKWNDPACLVVQIGRPNLDFPQTALVDLRIT